MARWSPCSCRSSLLYRDREGFLSIGELFVLGFAVAVAGVLGDLFESAVKRDLGVKDSGRILAGHGGMLDRVDALLFAGPVAYVGDPRRNVT